MFHSVLLRILQNVSPHFQIMAGRQLFRLVELVGSKIIVYNDNHSHLPTGVPANENHYLST